MDCFFYPGYPISELLFFFSALVFHRFYGFLLFFTISNVNLRSSHPNSKATRHNLNGKNSDLPGIAHVARTQVMSMLDSLVDEFAQRGATDSFPRVDSSN